MHDRSLPVTAGRQGRRAGNALPAHHVGGEFGERATVGERTGPQVQQCIGRSTPIWTDTMPVAWWISGWSSSRRAATREIGSSPSAPSRTGWPRRARVGRAKFQPDGGEQNRVGKLLDRQGGRPVEVHSKHAEPAAPTRIGITHSEQMPASTASGANSGQRVWSAAVVRSSTSRIPISESPASDGPSPTVSWSSSATRAAGPPAETANASRAVREGHRHRGAEVGPGELADDVEVQRRARARRVVAQRVAQVQQAACRLRRSPLHEGRRQSVASVRRRVCGPPDAIPGGSRRVLDHIADGASVATVPHRPVSAGPWSAVRVVKFRSMTEFRRPCVSISISTSSASRSSTVSPSAVR